MIGQFQLSSLPFIHTEHECVNRVFKEYIKKSLMCLVKEKEEKDMLSEYAYVYY